VKQTKRLTILTPKEIYDIDRVAASNPAVAKMGSEGEGED